MYHHPRRVPAHQDRRFKERQYENALQEKISFVHNYKNLMRYAEFESLNEPRTSSRSLAEKLAAIRAHRDEVLNEKRRRLAFLLEDEESTLNHEIKTGTMNLAERRAWLKAKAMSISAAKLQKGPNALGETKLEKAIHESDEDLAMHNSKAAIGKAEVEKKRQRQNDRDVHSSFECEDSCGEASNERAVDILRKHLHLVDHLREEEKMAVEEDLINMNQRWLEEDEALRRQLIELRHYHSLQAKDYLQCNEGSKGGMEFESHLAAMKAEREAEEERQLEEMKECQRKEARAYVAQLKDVVARQRFDDEELEALVKEEMEAVKCNSSPQFKGVNEGAWEDERNSKNESKLFKEDLVDVIEGQIRGLHAADIVEQETRRLANIGRGTKETCEPSKPRGRQLPANLPIPERYYGRRAVKWFE